ncbi:hypothetical protein TNCV_4197361 [Trichonephila clavipes]|nr:hypothetical protein TNCV_4197361 [Trichonephila clavipes]
MLEAGETRAYQSFGNLPFPSREDVTSGGREERMSFPGGGLLTATVIHGDSSERQLCNVRVEIHGDGGRRGVPSRHRGTQKSRRATGPLVISGVTENFWAPCKVSRIYLFLGVSAILTSRYKATREAICDGPRNFERRSSDENDTGGGTPLLTIPPSQWVDS